MFQLTFIFIGALAAIASYLAISRQVDEVLGGSFAMFFWTVWALYANSVTVVASSGEKVTEGYTPLFFLGVGAGLIMLLFVVRGVTGSLTPRDETRFNDNVNQ